MISIYLNGRLGNQLFQYVTIRFLSEKYKTNFYIPSNHRESLLFYNKVSNLFKIVLEDSTNDNPHFWIGDKIFDIDYGNCEGDL